MKAVKIASVIILGVIVIALVSLTVPRDGVFFSPMKFGGERSLEVDKKVVEERCISTEEICDAKDNDCDDLVDEGGVCDPKSTESVPGEIIIKFTEESDVKNEFQAKDFLVNALGNKKISAKVESVDRLIKRDLQKDNFGLDRIYKIKTDEEKVQDFIDAFEEDDIEYIEPNYIYQAAFVPNDPHYSLQWSHQNSLAESAWDIEIGNSNIVIALLDTGVDYNHEDLMPNIWDNLGEECIETQDMDGNGYNGDCRGYDFVDSSNPGQCGSNEDCQDIDNDPMDVHGHGTHCAGISAAKGNNNLGIAGVCQHCKIMPIRVGYKRQDGAIVYSIDTIVNGITYAIVNDADIINIVSKNRNLTTNQKMSKSLLISSKNNIKINSINFSIWRVTFKTNIHHTSRNISSSSINSIHKTTNIFKINYSVIIYISAFVNSASFSFYFINNIISFI